MRYTHNNIYALMHAPKTYIKTFSLF